MKITQEKNAAETTTTAPAHAGAAQVEISEAELEAVAGGCTPGTVAGSIASIVTSVGILVQEIIEIVSDDDSTKKEECGCSNS